MKAKIRDRILQVWDEIEAEEPDKSTEYLIARVVDTCKIVHKIRVDWSDVSVALKWRHDRREAA